MRSSFTLGRCCYFRFFACIFGLLRFSTSRSPSVKHPTPIVRATLFQRIQKYDQLYYAFQIFTLLFRSTINAVTVIPLITLLIPQAIIAVITFIINSN